MSAVTDQFRTKLKAAFAGEKARTDLNAYLKKMLNSDQDMVGCFRLYLTIYSAAERTRLDSDSRQRDRAIGYALWSRLIDLASLMNGFADLAPLVASVARGEPADRQTGLHPPLDLAKMAEMAFHWSDLAYSNPVDPRREIEQKSKRRQKDIQDSRGMISPLVDAYIQKTGESPTLQKLLEFNPADASLRKEFQQLVAQCDKVWRQYHYQNAHPVKPTPDNLKEVDAAFEAFGKFVENHGSDPLIFFQVLKWTRDLNRVEVKIVGEQGHVSQPDWTPVWQELYLEACLQGMRFAVGKWNLLTVQKAKKLIGDDNIFFIAPLETRERFKLQMRLEWSFKQVQAFKDWNTLRRRLGRFAQFSSLELLDELETVEIEKKIEDAAEKSTDKAAQQFIRIGSVHAAFKDTYHVGQDILDDFTILWIEGTKERPLVIIEFHNMDNVLFRADLGRFERLVKEAFWRKAAEIAEQVQQFMLAYLEAVGILLDVVTAIASAGTAGGIRRIATAYIKDKLREKVTNEVLDAFHIEGAGARFLAGAALNLGADLTHQKLTKPDLSRGVKNRGTDIDVPAMRNGATGSPGDVGKRLVPDPPKAPPPKIDPTAPPPSPRRLYPVVDQGKPKLVNEAERNALERARLKAKADAAVSTSPPRKYAILDQGKPKLVTREERDALERARMTTKPDAPAPKPPPRRLYPVVDNGVPKLVTETERQAIEAARPRTKSFVEQVMAGYIVPVKFGPTGAWSWFRNIFVGASSRQTTRRNLEKILNLERTGPLSTVLLNSNGRLYPGGLAGQNAAYWAANPELVQMAHVLSDNAEGPQLLIVMSAHYNQQFGRNIERGSIGVGVPSQVILEQAYVIQGVAIHMPTAHDLAAKFPGFAEAVNNATIIRFVQ